MKVNDYQVKTPESGDKLFGSNSNGDQVQFNMSSFSNTTYKVYTALLTQSGTDAPIATVLENTLGGDVTWTREVAGVYVGSSIGLFTLDKTALFIQKDVSLSKILVSPKDNSIVKIDEDTINIYTYDEDNIIDGVLNNTTIEIRVYN
jgi:hypothetical protein